MMTERKIRMLLAFLAVLLGFTLVVSMLFLSSSKQGSSLPVGGDFTLTGPNGSVSLSDFKGKVVALYFGYTFCPDVCPTSLAILGDAFSKLTPDELASVQGLFITLDPKRDTVERLEKYAPYFNVKIMGLSGEGGTIAELAKRYAVSYREQPIPGGDAGSYVIDHTSVTYLIDKKGRLTDVIPHGTSSQIIVDKIRQLIK